MSTNSKPCTFLQYLFCATVVYIRFPPQPIMPRFRFTFPSCYGAVASSYIREDSSKDTYTIHETLYELIMRLYRRQQEEQPWPSGETLDLDQRGPGFEAHRRPLVTSGRASGRKCSCQN